MNTRQQILGTILVLACLTLTTGCEWISTPTTGIGDPVPWSELPGWDTDRLSESLPALDKSCNTLAQSSGQWQAICQAFSLIDGNDERAVREFYQHWFIPHRIHDHGYRKNGLITGYYEPILQGSYTKDDQYRFPLYSQPDDLLTIKLDKLYPELKGKRLRGRVVGKHVVPYHSRSDLDKDQSVLNGSELLWVNDLVDLFFLHIQGSGRVQLPDGGMVKVGYADQNGHPYRSIGAELISRQELTREEVNMFSIRDWITNNPHQAQQLLHSNPSYVFFVLRKDAGAGPIGAMKQPLTAERSVAVDASIIPLGSPVWLSTTLPDGDQSYQRLMFAQDTGGAINGALRADVFWGTGERAEYLAGMMKQPGRLFVLLPKESTSNRL